jgi:hypothetical protein
MDLNPNLTYTRADTVLGKRTELRYQQDQHRDTSAGLEETSYTHNELMPFGMRTLLFFASTLRWALV